MRLTGTWKGVIMRERVKPVLFNWLFCQQYNLCITFQKEHHLDQLPEGWFYNGTQYVSFDGSKQDKHPGIYRRNLTHLCLVFF